MARPRFAPNPTRGQLWRRRIVGTIAIAALIGTPVYLLFIRDDGKDETPDLAKATTDPAEAAKLLTQQVIDKRRGIEVRYPETWGAEKTMGIVRVFSDDNSTGIGIVSKGGAVDAKRVFRESVNGIKANLKNPKVQITKKTTPTAGLPSASALVTGTDKAGAQRNVLVVVARGKKRSYVLTVLAPSGGGQIGIANLIFAQGLKLTG